MRTKTMSTRIPVAESPDNSRISHAPGIPEWLSPVLQSITLATVVGCAFWLGSLSNTVSRTAESVDKLTESKELMGNRLTAIETKLDAIDKKLGGVRKHKPRHPVHDHQQEAQRQQAPARTHKIPHGGQNSAQRFLRHGWLRLRCRG